MNLKDFKKVYFIGIKGVGMTALAQIFQAQGLNITGSDTEEKFMNDEVLTRVGIKYYEIYKQRRGRKHCNRTIIFFRAKGFASFLILVQDASIQFSNATFDYILIR